MSASTTLPAGPPVNTSIPNKECTLDTCSLLQAPFLYVPNLGGNVFFTAFFALLVVVHLVLWGIYRTHSYSFGMLLGTLTECVGYAVRIPMHFNPFPANPFLAYLICITIAPIFITASIYVCLGHIIVAHGSNMSRITPRLYTWIFITSDFISLLLQAGGGAMVEIANDFDFEWKGIHVMIGGLGLQVGSIIIFLLFFADFTQKARRKQSRWSEKYRQLCRSPGFTVFQLAILAATVANLIRSIFRVAELYQGFHGEIWNNEAAFMVLEGGAISFACLSLTIFHPGWNFSGAWHDTKTEPIRGRKTDTEAISLQ